MDLLAQDSGSQKPLQRCSGCLGSSTVKECVNHCPILATDFPDSIVLRYLAGQVSVGTLSAEVTLVVARVCQDLDQEFQRVLLSSEELILRNLE